LRALLRAERLADLPAFRAAFLPDLADFLALAFLAAFFRGRARVRPAGPSLSPNEDEDEEPDGVVLSIGSGSIHPEPDQPISI
jgi:hypothetical protein